MFATQLKNCQSLLDKCHPNGKSNYLFYRLFETKLNSIIRDVFVEKFWAHFSESDLNKNEAQSYKPFLEAIEFLRQSCQQIEKTLADAKYRSIRDKFLAALRIQILSQKPYYLNEYLEAVYFRAFKVFLTIKQHEESGKRQEFSSQGEFNDQENTMTVDNTDVQMVDVDETNVDYESATSSCGKNCPGCACSIDLCDCRQIYDRFCSMNEYLKTFGLLEDLVGDTVMTVARRFIELKVISKGKSDYSYSYLEELTCWVNGLIKEWIASIYKFSDEKEIDSIAKRLDQYLKDAYAEVRVSHMFEIIIEYPNSDAAIQDLKMCLDQSTSSDFRLNLIDSVKQSLVESLLHPGVNTYDILTAYISAIKALRALDPTGLILQLVTEPVRRYLKSRNDTVRCIVTALTDEDNNSELNREMIKSGAQTNENGIDGKGGSIEMNIPNEGEKCTDKNYESWKPDPIKLSASVGVNRFSDIVSILVNIYETKDLFVEEYQKLLSQRLLNKYDECNLDTELRNLELLTIRFSDCELHRCEVMLKDVQTSRRINKRILSGDIREHKLDDFKNLDALIVSSPFWPDKFSPMATLSDEPPNIEFPPEIESAISTYTKAFEAIQASRTLHWRHHLGSVNLDLTIDGRTQNFTVSPLHAALIYLFKEKTSWKLNELMHKTSLPAATIRNRLALWQRNGLIRDCGEDNYELITE